MTTSQLNDVSVVVTTYNGRAYVSEALKSIVAQTSQPAEIIVVDDRSTDGSPDVVAEFARTSKVPVRQIVLPANSGSPSRPINAGVAAANGTLIAVLDQDDVFHPEKLRCEADALRSDAKLSVVWSRSAPLHSRECEFPFFEVQEYFDQANDQTIDGSEFLKLLLLHGCFVVGFPGFMFRKSDWQARGGVDESLKIADHEFLCWLATRGRARLIPKIHYWRRFHDTNLSDNQVIVGLAYVEAVRRYLKHHPSRASLAPQMTALRDRLVGDFYLLRDNGHYRVALQAVRCMAAIWGWNSQLTAMAMKLPPHWVISRMQNKRQSLPIPHG